MKKLTSVLLMSLRRERERLLPFLAINCLHIILKFSSWNYIYEKRKPQEQGWECEYYQKPSEQARISQNLTHMRWINIRPGLICLNNQVRSNLAIMVWVGAISLPWNHTKKSRMHVNLSKHWVGKGQQSHGMTGNVRLAGSNCPICIVIVLSADFHFAHLLSRSNRVCRRCLQSF